jgi:hypothetical protein
MAAVIADSGLEIDLPMKNPAPNTANAINGMEIPIRR